MTQNTINYCRHHSPFRAEPKGQHGLSTIWKPEVRDRLGIVVCQCERIDDAWVVAEALNAVAEPAPPPAAPKPAHPAPTLQTRSQRAEQCGHKTEVIELAHCCKCNQVFWRCQVCDTKHCPDCL